ncbi:MAG: hypothetical protein PHN72_05715 [Bacilli bacterium]|nr:hypothetical protein [Bacilli bacterium]
MNEKGSIEKKKMTWWKALLYKWKKEKEKKKKEIEQIRIWQMQNYGKYYSKPKVVLLTVLGLFLGLLGTKTNTSTKKVELEKPNTYKEIQKDIEIIEEKKFKIVKVKEEIKPSLTPSEIIQKKEIIQTIIEEIKPIKEKYKEVELPRESKVIAQNMVAVENIKELVKETNLLAEETLTKGDTLLSQKKEDLQDLALVKETTPNKVTKGAISPKENQKVNDLLEKKEYKELKETIEKTNDILLLNECALKLNKLLEKTEDPILKEKYLKQLKKIEEKLQLQKQEEVSIVSSLLTSAAIGVAAVASKGKKSGKEIDKETEIKEHASIGLSPGRQVKEQNGIEKQIIKRTEDDLAEILFMEALICNSIKRHRREVKKFKKRVEKLKLQEKHKTIMSGIRHYLQRVIRLSFSLFPLSIFKNKKIGFLTSTILVNNNIRNMRNAVSKVEVPYIELDKIAKKIKDAEEEMDYARYICYDSLDQISSLKNEFMEQVGYSASPEIESVMKQMETLEKMLKARTEQIQKGSEHLQNVKEKQKQKVKKLETIYDKI